MKRLLVSLLATGLLAVTVAAPVAAAPATGITATPASTQSFANCTATFVRSASGIINETNRVCDPLESPALYVQFRPLTGPNGTGSPTPNPTCDPKGLVTTFTYVNSVSSISGTPATGYFIGSNPYTVCFYFVNPVVATGTVDSSLMAGTTATLPTYPWVVSGHFRIDVSGEWLNTPHGLVDAQYNNGDNGTTEPWPLVQMGWPGLGDGWGRLLVNGGLVNWGAFNASHMYSYTLSTTGSITLNVFDGDASSGLSYVPSWYSDNVGLLSYTITYLGL